MTIKTIGLVGFGVENASAWRYLSKKYPDAAFTIYDEKTDAPVDIPESVAFVGGSDFSTVDADLLVRSPGISPYRLPADAAVTSATKIFFDECPLPVIGVTGSKGKGTTASLVASILTAGGVRNWLVGNIGNPALDTMDSWSEGDVIVYELSSFQLWDIEKSPQTAVVLMVEPEHLDVHRDLADYIDAKTNIARFQTDADTLVYNAENEISQRISEYSPARHVGYPSHDAAHIRSGNFCYGETVICPVETLRLPGQHNVENALAAIDASWQCVDDPAAIERGLRAFTGLPHRLKFVRDVNGVEYYDDSIATTPGSAIAAIRAFGDAYTVLILGGSSKGADFSGLAREIVNSHSVRHVYAIGQEAGRIMAALSGAGYANAEILAPNTPMAEIVRVSSHVAQPGDRVVLSPACASFGEYKNYADRGDQFIAAVEGLAQ